MGKRRIPLRFLCGGCGQWAETYATSNQGVYCSKACRGLAERATYDRPGSYLNRDGYRMLRWFGPDGKRRYQFEHRRVWEDANGPIPDGFIVHHINEDKLDNRIENLHLMRRGDHNSHHAAERRARKVAEQRGVGRGSRRHARPTNRRLAFAGPTNTARLYGRGRKVWQSGRRRCVANRSQR